jgi:hypothetical protein
MRCESKGQPIEIEIFLILGHFSTPVTKGTSGQSKDISYSMAEATAWTPAAAEMSDVKDASHSKDVSCGRA